jgi:UDP-GlcNAc:undecaprenyl-phosphate/decaprenyl-phosphate GlcNAc-1-phosphate transferase
MTENVNFFAFVLATVFTALSTPAAIAVAHRTAFYDHPVGYKQHGAPTPYLGGIAVVLGLVAGALALGGQFGQIDTIVLLAAGVLAVGTVDDRHGLGLGLRLVAEVAVGVALFYAGFGWNLFGGEALDLVVTVAFVVGVINAYNLMDNLDGATSTVALAAAAAICFYATFAGAPVIGVLAAALAGACVGFLPYNLASPRARIFLGDGGSMAIGFTLAALIMSLPGTGEFGWALLPVTVIVVGLPAFDTALVIVSRLRRRVNVVSGGRDHLTHRLYARYGSTWRVAIALLAGQAAACGFGFALLQLSPPAAAISAAVAIGCGVALIAALETIWAGISLQPAAVQPVQDRSAA